MHLNEADWYVAFVVIVSAIIVFDFASRNVASIPSAIEGAGAGAITMGGITVDTIEKGTSVFGDEVADEEAKMVSELKEKETTSVEVTMSADPKEKTKPQTEPARPIDPKEETKTLTESAMPAELHEKMKDKKYVKVAARLAINEVKSGPGGYWEQAVGNKYRWKIVDTATKPVSY